RTRIVGSMPSKNRIQLAPANPMPNAIGTPMRMVAKKINPMTKSIMNACLSDDRGTARSTRERTRDKAGARSRAESRAPPRRAGYRAPLRSASWRDQVMEPGPNHVETEDEDESDAKEDDGLSPRGRH